MLHVKFKSSDFALITELAFYVKIIQNVTQVYWSSAYIYIPIGCYTSLCCTNGRQHLKCYIYRKEHMSNWYLFSFQKQRTVLFLYFCGSCFLPWVAIKIIECRYQEKEVHSYFVKNVKTVTFGLSNNFVTFSAITIDIVQLSKYTCANGSLGQVQRN